MNDLWDELLHWSRGVITSAEPDRAELQNALVRNDNGMFASVANGVAQVRKRLGMGLCNSTPVNDVAGVGPSIVFGAPYKYVSGGTTTRYTTVLTGTGNVHFFVDDGAATNLTPTASHAAALTNGVVSGDAAEMNNRLFMLDNLAGRAAFLGTAETAWGVSPPTGLALANTGAGVMIGTYEVVVTEWDADINAESNISDAVEITGLASEQLRVTVDAVAVGLTNRHFRVYIRKTASPNLGGQFIRVLAGTGYVGGTVMGFPLFAGGATTSTDINISDATITEGLLAPPQSGAHGVPPTTAKYAAVFQRRLFLADDSNVYWSELDKPDAFNPLSVEPIASPRGGSVVGLIPMASGRGIHILTETGRHSIVGGSDPKGWTIDIEDPELGSVNRGSIVGYRKVIATWDSDHGPVLLSPDGQAAYIGTDFIRDNVKASVLSSSNYALWQSAALDGRIIFGIVDGGQTVVQRFLVFNLEVGAWESTNWDPMDAASLFVSYDSDGEGHVYLGNYNGQLFRLLTGGTDGVRDGAVQGTFVAGASTIGTITDGTLKSVTSITRAGAVATATVPSHGYATDDAVYIRGAVEVEYNGLVTITVTGVDTFTYAVGGAPASPATGTITVSTQEFDTTGAGLRQRRVRLVGPDGQVVLSSRIHISSNTATELTLSANFSGLTAGATYTYLVGGPDFVLETYWGNMRLPFVDKRFDLLFSEFRVDEGVSNIAIRMAFSWDENRDLSVSTLDEAASLWDDAEWDVSNWDGQAVINRRLAVIKRGFNYRIQLRNPFPNQGFTVLKLATLARRLSDRYAGNSLRST